MASIGCAYTPYENSIIERSYRSELLLGSNVPSIRQHTNVTLSDGIYGVAAADNER